MNTNFCDFESKELLEYGENIEKVLFYNAGEVVGEVREIQEHVIKKTVDSVHDGTAKNVYILNGLKRANKLNLNRKDNFLLKNPEKVYSFEKKYILYIHVSSVTFENAGELLAADHSHEKCYLQAYYITFPAADFIRNMTESIECENYTLQNGETFGDFFGPDKEHAKIKPFLFDSDFIKKAHPEKYMKKGVYRKWNEKETLYNHKMLITKPTYTRIEKDEHRKKCEEIADKMTAAGVKVSYFDIERLLAAGIKIEY